MADYDLSGVNLPYNPDAEQSVLGCVLLDGGVLGEIVGTLHPEHFYAQLNRDIFAVMTQMYMTSERIDVVTVLDACMRQGVFESADDAKKYLATVMEAVPSVSSIAKYAGIVTEKYLLRSLILASKEIIDAASAGAENANDIVDYAEQRIYDIRAGVENKSLTHISGIVFDRVKALNELVKVTAANGGQPVMSGLPTGFLELDRRIFGLNRSDLLILAARPGMGKTSFAMNIAVNVGKKYRDKQICVFSLEMSKEQIVARMINSEALLPSEAMKTGKVAADKWKQIMESADMLSQLPIYIDDTPGCNVSSIKSKLRRMKNLGVVIIDYLQLMTAVSNFHGNRVAEISEITRQLKVLAKELNVPVIALSQLARGPEQRPDKRPLLSDLRDSGSIEQDADIVMFLYRNAYYDKTDPNQNVCECIVAKNRHGETGTAYLGWQGEFTRFTNVEVKYENNGN
ncbi:MAG: replicative DNA helicase [Oscillospiraceae bacterium]|nr:replicative DNA helicase [Oscillospiraceae bacterium]